MSEKPSRLSTSKKSEKSGRSEEQKRAAKHGKHGHAAPKLSVAEAKSDRKKR